MQLGLLYKGHIRSGLILAIDRENVITIYSSIETLQTRRWPAAGGGGAF